MPKKQVIGGPMKKEPEEVISPVADEPSSEKVETPVEEPSENTPEAPEEEKNDPPIDAEEFFALPPKQAYQAYIEQKSAKEALQAEVDKKMQDALDTLRTELETKHQTDMQSVKDAIRQAIYEE